MSPKSSKPKNIKDTKSLLVVLALLACLTVNYNIDALNNNNNYNNENNGSKNKNYNNNDMDNNE